VGCGRRWLVTASEQPPDTTTTFSRATSFRMHPVCSDPPTTGTSRETRCRIGAPHTCDCRRRDPTAPHVARQQDHDLVIATFNGLPIDRTERLARVARGSARRRCETGSAPRRASYRRSSDTPGSPPPSATRTSRRRRCATPPNASAVRCSVSNAGPKLQLEINVQVSGGGSGI
jgi:hypothetical protein